MNIISVLLSYIYLPPANANMVNLIPQITILQIFNIISIILFAGRAFDAIIDPVIAHLSDKHKGKLGRRIPFMRLAFIPMSFFCILLFFPTHHYASNTNILWMAVIQLLYYLFFGMFLIPYNALLAELGQTPQAKLDLSMAQSIGFMFGVLISAASPAMASGLQNVLPHIDRLQAYQYCILGLNVFAALCMAVPSFLINEKKYCKEAVVTEPLLQSLKTALRNRNFVRDDSMQPWLPRMFERIRALDAASKGKLMRLRRQSIGLHKEKFVILMEDAEARLLRRDCLKFEGNVPLVGSYKDYLDP